MFSSCHLRRAHKLPSKTSEKRYTPASAPSHALPRAILPARSSHFPGYSTRHMLHPLLRQSDGHARCETVRAAESNAAPSPLAPPFSDLLILNPTDEKRTNGALRLRAVSVTGE